MNGRLLKALIVIGFVYLLTNLPDGYGWLKILLLVAILLWMWFGDKILKNKRR
ncbi:hypothetical protein AAK938_07875 [Aerococcaceae bacterium 50-4]